MGNCLKITENIRGEPEDSLIAGGRLNRPALQ